MDMLGILLAVLLCPSFLASARGQEPGPAMEDPGYAQGGSTGTPAQPSSLPADPEVRDAAVSSAPAPAAPALSAKGEQLRAEDRSPMAPALSAKGEQLRAEDRSPMAPALSADRVPRAPVGVPPGWKPLRGVHLTAWVAGDGKARRRFLDRLDGTIINAVVIPLKETDGRVYIHGVALADSLGTTRRAIPDPAALIRDVKERRLRAVARIVLFEDDALPRKKPEWGIRTEGGGLWKTRAGRTWVDPYRREVWDYNLQIALRAVALGFDEVQFDYVRFPSDGDTGRCRYWRVDHSSRTAVEALTGFLEYARNRLRPTGAGMSIAIFGLTTTTANDMGIGQRIASMGGLVDAISPMMYPSHYAKREYGLRDPNREPYKIINWGLRDAKRKLGPAAYKLRPYMQDFSHGFRYRTEQVQAQIRAARDQGISSWIFWNPVNKYHWDAFVEEPPSPEFVPPRL
ncbi:MAG TPA: hypothetical protein DD417_18610 [Elusimicrobia bacterium]|nr:hypothetical protein [Elusimicrobiota bacterium]